MCASTREFRFQILMFACKHAPGTTYSSLHSCNYTIKCTCMHECILHKYNYEYIQTYTHTNIHTYIFSGLHIVLRETNHWIGATFDVYERYPTSNSWGRYAFHPCFFLPFHGLIVLFIGTLFISTLQKANRQMINNLWVLFLTILSEIFFPVGRRKKRASENCQNGTR